MEWVKTTAKTLPEAIDLALDNLGVDESEAEIVVLEEPRQGLFGRMRGTARVEARVKPKPIRPKTERNRNRRSRSEGGSKGGNDRNRNRNRNRGGKGQGGQGGQGGGNRNSGNRNDGGGNDNRQSSKGNGGDRNRQDADAEGQDGQAQGQKKSSGRNRSRQGGAGGGRDQGGRNGQQGSKGRNRDNAQDTKPKEDTPVEEVAAHLQTFLSDLTEAFGLDSDVTVDSSEADILVGKIEGQHGLLVGPKGRTLDAVQELARISCQRTVPSSVRIKVDVGGYRAKRVEALQEFARKAADNAAEGQTEVALEPMSPADRKAIHDALTDDDRVETRSVGAEPRRKVLVVPVYNEDADDSGDDVADDSAEDTVEENDSVEASAGEE